LRQGDLSKGEKLLDEAIQRQEARLGPHPWKEDVDSLVPFLLRKAEILRLRDREREADGVMQHIDQMLAKLRPQIHLDDQMQAQVVQLVRDATDKLLCLKYHTKNASEARATLPEVLTSSALPELVRFPWYPKDPNSVRTYAADSNAPHAVNLELDEISVRSPDNMGYLTVRVQGRSRLAARTMPVREGHFAFVYKVKLPEDSRGKMLIADVSEVPFGASEW
jgi:hypothetical protein